MVAVAACCVFNPIAPCVCVFCSIVKSSTTEAIPKQWNLHLIIFIFTFMLKWLANFYFYFFFGCFVLSKTKSNSVCAKNKEQHFNIDVYRQCVIHSNDLHVNFIFGAKKKQQRPSINQRTNTEPCSIQTFPFLHINEQKMRSQEHVCARVQTTIAIWFILRQFCFVLFKSYIISVKFWLLLLKFFFLRLFDTVIIDHIQVANLYIFVLLLWSGYYGLCASSKRRASLQTLLCGSLFV